MRPVRKVASVSFKDSLQTDPYLPTVSSIIGLFCLWAISFSRSCASDGCIGVVVPLGGAAVALVLQLFVCLPVYAWRSSRQARYQGGTLVAWVLVSCGLFGATLALVN
jgi:hypothetical protein